VFSEVFEGDAEMKVNADYPRGQARVEREAKVIKFLLANPLSSSEEVSAATGCGVGDVRAGLLKYTQYNGKRCYRISHLHYKKLFL